MNPTSCRCSTPRYAIIIPMAKSTLLFETYRLLFRVFSRIFLLDTPFHPFERVRHTIQRFASLLHFHVYFGSVFPRSAFESSNPLVMRHMPFLKSAGQMLAFFHKSFRFSQIEPSRTCNNGLRRATEQLSQSLVEKCRIQPLHFKQLFACPFFYPSHLQSFNLITTFILRVGVIFRDCLFFISSPALQSGRRQG